MNGAEALMHAAAASGVEVCFANPGTTEMDMVKALDKVRGIRPILGLFEGVCTGAADGYARMSGKPAMTLLHLGPGFANGIANLHNARRARTPMINLVGEHASYHIEHDAPLTTDIESLARPVSHWLKRTKSAGDMASDMTEAYAAALTEPGIATLILSADYCWSEVPEGEPPKPAAITPKAVDSVRVDEVAKKIRGASSCAILLGGHGCREEGLRAAQRIAGVAGCKVFHETFVPRLDRGAGRAAVERIPYFPEGAVAALAGVKTLILAGAKAPVAFFAYPGQPSLLAPEDCAVVTLADEGEDPRDALDALAEALSAPAAPATTNARTEPALPTGKLTLPAVGAALNALLPEGAIVMEEGLTSGEPLNHLTRGANPHTMMYLTGGAIGQGLPAATGAAVACPDRKTVAIQSDGAGMYTVQALWTQAREGLDVTTILLSNRTYQILQLELMRAGVTERGPSAESLTSLSRPDLDWSSIARGMGVPAVCPESAEDFADALERGFSEDGPLFIEVKI